MLTFFRRIRKGLLEGNRTSKYLLYVIGEIALVVIGILIALQINNWNEWRKMRLQERDLLTELYQGLKQDSADITGNIEVQSIVLRSQNILMEWLDSDSEYADSLDYHFAAANLITIFPPSDGPYHTLQEVGMKIVQNDSIRSKIMQVYDYLYESTIQNTQFYKDLNLNTLNSVHSRYFTSAQLIDPNNPKFIGKMTPKDIDKIRSEDEFRYHLDLSRNYNEFILNYNIIPTREEILKLMKMIRDELE